MKISKGLGQGYLQVFKQLESSKCTERRGGEQGQIRIGVRLRFRIRGKEGMEDGWMQAKPYDGIEAQLVEEMKYSKHFIFFVTYKWAQ